MLDHANKQRNDVNTDDQHQESISLTNEMYDLMMKYPWSSVSILNSMI